MSFTEQNLNLVNRQSMWFILLIPKQLSETTLHLGALVSAKS
jgi:hypothetical protein